MTKLLVGFDLETEPIGPGRLAPRLVCLSTYYHAEDRVSVALRRPSLVEARRLLVEARAGRLELVGANVAFDLADLASEEPELLPLVFETLDACGVYDVQIAERLRAIALGRLESDPELRGAPPSFSLAECVLRYTGRDRSASKGPDSWRLRYAELAELPVEDWPREAREYCEDDARDPVIVALAQRETIGGELPLFRETIRHAFALHLMSARGIRTDGASVEELDRKLRAILAESNAKLVEAGILRPNGTENTKETKRRVRAALGEAAPLTDKGKELAAERDLSEEELLKYTAAGEEVLELCEGLDEGLDLWREVKIDRKELSSFVPTLRAGSIWPINARFNVCVSTFRTSCSKPNLQQQPRRSGVRECFVPRPGYVLCSVDYHVAELCSLAQVLLDLFGASSMADELRAGRDLHLVFAAELASVSYEEALRLYTSKDPRVSELRQASKAANFGIPGGLGAPGLQRYAKGYGLILSLDEARTLRDHWLDRFPEMRRYFAHVGALARGGSFTHVHQRTGFIRGGVGYCDGCNQSFQHLTAAGCKEALYRASREAYTDPASSLWGSYPLIMIHDEILAELPEARADEAAHRLAEIMVCTMNEYTPDVPARAEPALMRRWYKSADPVFDASGRLVPWSPK